MDFFFASGVKGVSLLRGWGLAPFGAADWGGLKGGAAPLTSARGYNASCGHESMLAKEPIIKSFSRWPYGAVKA